MKISYNLIKEFLPDLKASPADLAEEFCTKLAEVESVTKVKDDYILEIENKALTHRPDCFSHWGLAREAAAFYNLKCQNPELPNLETVSDSKELAVEIQTDKCSRYNATTMAVSVKESPLWLKNFLKSVDIHPINNVVDITNYIMLKYGQPLHAYSMTSGINPPLADDNSKLKTQNSKIGIIVRQASETEKITTIDNKQRTLDETMMVIADSEKPIAIAGIMGGKESEIGDEAQQIILESANFEMYSIRKTSAKLGLRSDASTRFEKNLDPNLVSIGLIECLKLLKEIAHAEDQSPVVEIYPVKRENTKIKMDPTRVKTFLGIDISNEKAASYLKSLELSVDIQEKNKWEIEIPTFRSDLNIEVDLLEEIARLYDLNKIQTTLPKRDLAPTPVNKKISMRNRTRKTLQALGFDEVYNYSFISKDDLQRSLMDKINHIELQNPLSGNHALFRPSLWPGLIHNLLLNLKYFRELSIFEIGRKIIPSNEKGKLPDEIETLGLMICHTTNNPPTPDDQKAIYQELNSKIDYLFQELFLPEGKWQRHNPSVKFGKRDLEVDYLGITKHPQRAVFMKPPFEGPTDIFGHLGNINTDIIDNYLEREDSSSSTTICVAEIELETLYELLGSQKPYSPVPIHPVTTQDLTILVDQSTSLDKLRHHIIDNKDPLLKKIEIVDVYTDSKTMADREKSVSIRFFFQSQTKTLTHSEISKLVNNISAMLESRFRRKRGDKSLN